MTASPFDHATRIAMVRERLADAGHDALLVTDLFDVRWLTGFGGSNGWVVVRGDEVTLGTDGRYGDRAEDETAGSGVTVVAELRRADLHQRLRDAVRGSSSIALDPEQVGHGDWTRLATDFTLTPAPSIVGRLRMRKDAVEIERIATAAAAADAALADVEPLLLGTVDTPVTEADVRNELEYRMRLHGADDRSYDTIVASGPEHAARPHHEVSRRTIVEGDTVIIDVGALVDGYHSDMTRSYVIGEPTAEQRDWYGLVEASHRAGVDALRAGIAARDLDAACRAVYEEAGVLEWYLHGTGHGVGLQIHEPPFHSAISEDVIEQGYVVTVEPGLYRVGFGGFRIEDLLVVTEDGASSLTHTPPRPLAG